MVTVSSNPSTTARHRDPPSAPDLQHDLQVEPQSFVYELAATERMDPPQKKRGTL
jgi:hypothetical protein